MVWLFFRYLFALGISAVLIATASASVFLLKWAHETPDYHQLDSWTLSSTTRVYARDHTLIGILSPTLPGGARINRTLVSLNEISPYMTAAAITSEDWRFFEHYGLDPMGVGRGLLKTIKGERVEGGSTLTNQLIKNTLLADLEGARTAQRKIKEWWLSIQVERTFTKEEILGNYLNVLYWGRGGPIDIIGIHAAAKAYFNKDPRDLTLAESVYLTMLIPSPGRYFKYEAYRPLMFNLLERMVEDRWITREDAEKAKLEPLQPNGWTVQYDAKGNIKRAELSNPNAIRLSTVVTERAPHFMQQVERELINRFGREKVYGAGGLNVYTTLDPQAQQSAEDASRAARVPRRSATVGLVMLDPYNGEVLAMVGQRLAGSHADSEWNNAAQGIRQVGSSIKPLLYTTAIEKGFSQTHTELDSPTTFYCSGCKNGVYAPNNFGNIYTHRPVTLRYSLDHSLNLPTVRLATRIGLNSFLRKLEVLDLPVTNTAGLSASIGTIETSPLKMAAAYAPFVNGGIWYKPTYLKRVQTAAGQVLLDSSRDKPVSRRVWSPQTAYVGLDMLLGVVNDLGEKEGGLAWRARIPGRLVGGKTGTTNDVKDMWFVGVTPQIVGAVWIGRQNGGAMPYNAYSGEYNPPIFKAMVEGALKGKAPGKFAIPDGIAFLNNGSNKVAYITRQTNTSTADNYRVLPQQSAQDNGPNYNAVEDLPVDNRTLVVALDRRLDTLADEFTPAADIEMRRVNIDDLALYQNGGPN